MRQHQAVSTHKHFFTPPVHLLALPQSFGRHSALLSDVCAMVVDVEPRLDCFIGDEAAVC